MRSSMLSFVCFCILLLLGPALADGHNDQTTTQQQCVMNDQLARTVEQLWKDNFDEANLLPVVGVPSTGEGVMTLTHEMGGPDMSINGQVSKSPLANYALYSAECSDNKYLNLYEVMIPDIPGKHGNFSTAEFYVNSLRDHGLDVAGVHFVSSSRSFFLFFLFLHPSSPSPCIPLVLFFSHLFLPLPFPSLLFHTPWLPSPPLV